MHLGLNDLVPFAKNCIIRQSVNMSKQLLNTKLNWALGKDSGDLQTYRANANLKVVLNRPQNGNALTSNMVTELVKCFRLAAEDSSVSRIIITGNGRFFCTGMDLAKSSTGVGKSNDMASSEFRKFVELFEAIDQSPKVTIACINGPCYAGGVGLAFACDIRLTVSQATFTLSEVKLGLCPAIISKYIAREWGLAVTREAMLTGRSVTTAELKIVGALHGFVEDVGGLQALLDEYVSNMRYCAPGASAMCKRTCHAAWSYSGTEKQHGIIKKIFEEMMGPGTESSIGVGNFQAGKKNTDWDSLKKSLHKL